jgi:hypothetical protein
MKEALEAASKAKGLISIYNGACHQDCVELEEMIKTIEITNL